MKNIINRYIIHHYNVISFDIFDTLIERDVKRPSDIFRIVGKNVLGEAYAEEFCSRRQKAEQISREKKAYGEITLDEIYEELNYYDRDTVSKLMEEEICQEIKSCHLKEETKKIYNQAVQANKKIYLISDMYLPPNVICEMLEKCKIRGFEKVYISNFYNENKISGKLFQLVLDENSIKRKEMIHIGDSIKADFLGAHKVGINALLIRRKNRLERLIRS